MEIAKMMMGGGSENLHCTKIQDLILSISTIESNLTFATADDYFKVYDDYNFDDTVITPNGNYLRLNTAEIYSRLSAYIGKYLFSDNGIMRGKITTGDHTNGSNYYSISGYDIGVGALDDTTRFRVSNKVEFSTITDKEGKRFTPIG